MWALKKRNISLSISEINFDTVVFPYTNGWNNGVHSHEGMYIKPSNRKSVAYDVSFLTVNMMCMCNDCLRYTSVCYAYAAETAVLKCHWSNNWDVYEYI